METSQSDTSTAPSIQGVLTTSSVLNELWQRAAPTLTASELVWFDLGAIEYAKMQALNIKTVVEGLGCLIASDTNNGALQDRDGISSLLFSISASLDGVTGLIDIGVSASARLKYPDIYGVNAVNKG